MVFRVIIILTQVSVEIVLGMQEIFSMKYMSLKKKSLPN